MKLLTTSADHVDVWLAVPDDASAESCRSLLSPDERERHDRFHFAPDRIVYAAAHALLRRALSRYADVAPVDWRFVTDAHGKPSVDTKARLPAIGFNLSHTRGLCACVVSGAQTVGVDVEEMRPQPDLFLVASSFAAIEIAALRRDEEPARHDRFYALWTLKESYLKARGLGLAMPLDQFGFTIDHGRIDLTLAPSLGDTAQRWRFALAAPTPRHRLAVAVTQRDGVTPMLSCRFDPLRADAHKVTLPVLALS